MIHPLDEEEVLAAFRRMVTAFRTGECGVHRAARDIEDLARLVSRRKAPN